MPVFITAFSKNFLVFFSTPILSPQFMRSIEMLSSYYVNRFHSLILGCKGNNSCNDKKIFLFLKTIDFRQKTKDFS
jgi:hypothetical protein